MPNFHSFLRARRFSTTTDTALEIAPYDSATPNFTIEAGGKLKWSSGSAAADTTLYRSGSNVLKTDDSFDVAAGQTYKVDGADVLSATTLGSSVVNSSLTSVGSLTSLTAATPNFTGPATFSSNVIVSGNLTVNGTTTTVNSETVTVNDNIIVLNNNVTGSPTENAGIEIERGTSTNVDLRWNEANDKWELTNNGSTYGNIVTTENPPKLIIPHTFVVSGAVMAAVGQVDYINPFFVKVPASQTVKLISARHRINSGTSATVKVQINGSDAAGFTGMVVGTTAGDTDPADITLSNNDLVSLVVTAVSGSPLNMSVTLFFEYTWVG